MDYISIGFVYEVGTGKTLVVLWDEDSKALRFKDSDEASDGFLSVGMDTPPQKMFADAGLKMFERTTNNG